MTPPIAVIIATRNRPREIERYALDSLARSEFRDFLCVVWDASGDDQTERVAGRDWGFPILYRRAPRPGLTSQRNDAVEHVLGHYPSVRYLLFIDDDCYLSADALQGVMDTFCETKASLVSLPMYPHPGETMKRNAFSVWLQRKLGWKKHGVTDFLYNYGSHEEERGAEKEWASGGGMAVDAAVFRDERYFFPEDFQRFGGYALGEDFAFSHYLHKKRGKTIVNSLYGHFLHYPAPGARLDIAGLAASKWYNFHLLFNAIYDDVCGLRLLWLKLKFKLFMMAAALKVLVRCRSRDLPAVLRGVGAARRALKTMEERGA